MNRLLRSILAGGMVTAAAVPFISACSDNHVTLFIRQVPEPTPPECTVKNDPTATSLLSGFLDVAVRTSYQGALLVGNQMTPRGDKQNARAESTRIALDRAEVRLSNSADEQFTCAGDENCGSFSVFGSGFVDPSSSNEPGYGVFSLEMIPSVLGLELRDQLGWLDSTKIVARMKVLGETLGGESVESGEYTFTINICKGCTVAYNAGQCCDLNAEPVASDGEPACYIGQDNPNPSPCSACQNVPECLKSPNVNSCPTP